MSNQKKKSINSANSYSTSGATTPPSQRSLNFINSNKFGNKTDYGQFNSSFQGQVNHNSPIRP